VAKFGFAVNNRKKNQTTGAWEDEPVFLDVEAFNRGDTGKQADQVEQYLTKGRQVFIEGHLRMDNWTDKEGQKRSKLVIVVETFQFLEPRPEGMGSPSGETGMTRAPRPAASPSSRAPAAPAASNGGRFYEAEPDSVDAPPGGGNGTEDDIPF